MTSVFREKQVGGLASFLRAVNVAWYSCADGNVDEFVEEFI
jgi:hypothetical protein